VGYKEHKFVEKNANFFLVHARCCILQPFPMKPLFVLNSRAAEAAVSYWKRERSQ